MGNSFETQLKELQSRVVTMGALCENAISLSVKALLMGDKSLIEKVIEVDSRIDEAEREIESLCMRALLKYHPVARDLRVVSSALKMISDMERIGDQAADIAEIVATMGGGSKIIIQNGHIGEMARTAIKMVTDSIEAYVKSDKELARQVYLLDDRVDGLFCKVKQELIKTLSDKEQEDCLDLLMVAKYLERIGDHAENIAGWALYSMGEQPEI